jgi:Na+-transporting NADH:ubiquinone oxidoreductase subunit A
MALHRIRRGLDVPLAGTPDQMITDGPETSRVALVADDFHGLKPRVRVEPGQMVRRGELLCEDASTPGVGHTAPGAGRVIAVNRGARRVLHSIVIELSEGERAGDPAEDELLGFGPPAGTDPDAVGPSGVRDALVRSGLWTALRRRPFSRVPDPATTPRSIFVTAIDTNPLAGDPEVMLGERRDDFQLGLRAVATLTDGNTYVCVRAGSALARGVDAPVTVEEFAGPHPAGTAGVHIHRLEPVGPTRSVWTVGYQDVASIGALFRTGHLDVRRTVAIGGPPVVRPRLVRSRVGAAVADFAREVDPGEDVRWISGSVLSGKAAHGEIFGYMGRYDVQLSVLREGGERELLAWLAPGRTKFSALPAFVSRLFRGRPMDITTDAHGSRRAIIPIGLYERVVPMDLLPTFLLRALASGDTERAEELGCLELDEEDLALCSFVDPGKADFGPMLRRTLETIEKAG